MSPRGAGLLAAAVWFTWLLLLAAGLGLHTDEASDLYANLDRLARWHAGEPIDRFVRFGWRFTPIDAHPFLHRLLTFGWLLLSDGESLAALRVPNIAMGAAAVGCLTAVLARIWGGTAAAAGFLFLAASPRFLAYAGLAIYDPLLMATTLLAALALWRWRAARRPERRMLTAALLALLLMFASKLNAVFAGAGFILWAAAAGDRKRAGVIAALVVAAGLAYLLIEPQFWCNRGDAMRTVFAYHLQHRSYPMLFMGVPHADGRHVVLYPLLQVLSSLPLPHLLALGAGCLWLRREKRTGGRLLLQQAAWLATVLLGVAMFPGTPKYAGIRLLLCLYPFLAIIAAFGVHRLCCCLRHPRLPAVCLLAMLAWPAASLLQLYPHHALYANALVGGARGWAALGNETFAELMHLTPGILAAAEQYRHGNERLLMTPYSPYVAYLYRHLQLGKLDTIEEGEPSLQQGDLLLIYESHMPDRAARDGALQRRPLAHCAVSGIPLMTLYRW